MRLSEEAEAVLVPGISISSRIFGSVRVLEGNLPALTHWNHVKCHALSFTSGSPPITTRSRPQSNVENIWRRFLSCTKLLSRPSKLISKSQLFSSPKISKPSSIILNCFSISCYPETLSLYRGSLALPHVWLSRTSLLHIATQMTELNSKPIPVANPTQKLCHSDMTPPTETIIKHRTR